MVCGVHKKQRKNGARVQSRVFWYYKLKLVTNDTYQSRNPQRQRRLKKAQTAKLQTAQLTAQ